MGWILLGVLGVLAIAGFSAVVAVKIKIREVSRQAFGTDSFIEGLNNTKETLADTPKSVCAMTNIYLPQIMRDFPEFNYEEFKNKAKNMLFSALTAISSDNIDVLSDACDDLESKVLSVIETNKANGYDENYSQLRMHRMEITRYQKMSGTCIVTLQCAVQFMHTVKKISDGTLVDGDEQLMHQARYNIDLMYVQDEKKAESVSGNENAVGTHCPNCGAPISNLGAKLCEYCGMAVQAVNIRVWSIKNYTEV